MKIDNRIVMPIPFEAISKRLEDPFFAARCLGKEVLLQHIVPIERFDEPPQNLSIVEWEAADSQTIIEYSFEESMLGPLLIASTPKGICFTGFASGNGQEAKDDLHRRFPLQRIVEQRSAFHGLALGFCNGNRGLCVPLHLKGTDFQKDIWRKLVRIPLGRVTTYGHLLKGSSAYRAVGSAVGANPIAYIVPCHRVVRSNGDFRGYRWGSELKRLLLAFELQPIN